jgi:glucose/arabinose dehydrogenase
VSADPNIADPDSAEILLTIGQPERNHNGGLVKFGPDGYLYIGMGDGGGAGDRHGSIGNGQDPAALLGKILRIDVDNGDPYAVPASNPFVSAAGYRPEIWSLGWRNPWRFAFDRASGDLYVADVGQGDYEEINFQPAASAGGENYGWRIMEGQHCFDPRQECDPSGLVPPVAEYDHDFGCSVTGGYVYRGQAYPWLDGVYFFADYCSGIVWSLERDASGEWQMSQVFEAPFRVSSFGEDRAGELYLVGHNNGTVHRLTSTSP